MDIWYLSNMELALGVVVAVMWEINWFEVEQYIKPLDNTKERMEVDEPYHASI